MREERKEEEAAATFLFSFAHDELLSGSRNAFLLRWRRRRRSKIFLKGVRRRRRGGISLMTIGKPKLSLCRR